MSVVPESKDLKGQQLISSDGATVGMIEDVYYDGGTGDVEFLEVKAGGRFRAKKHVVPVEGAQADADAIRVPYDEDHIKSAPSVDAPAGGELGSRDEAVVMEHYGIDR